MLVCTYKLIMFQDKVKSQCLKKKYLYDFDIIDICLLCHLTLESQHNNIFQINFSPKVSSGNTIQSRYPKISDELIEWSLCVTHITVVLKQLTKESSASGEPESNILV